MIQFRYSTTLLIVLLCFAGCSRSKQPECYPVHGQVSYKGKPVAEAIVVLHRAGGDIEGNQKPIAYTAANGEFSVTTFKQGDGAPPGDYAITVELRAAQTIGEEVVRSGPNLLPAKFARPESSGIKVSVQPGENEIPAINLQ